VGEASKKSEQGPIVGVGHSAVHGGATTDQGKSRVMYDAVSGEDPGARSVRARR
jgi:hypothetical protein